MSDRSVTGSERPRYCETEGCYREPSIRLWLGLEESSAENEYRWKCDPCHSAMIEGNQIPGGNIQAARSLDTEGDSR